MKHHADMIRLVCRTAPRLSVLCCLVLIGGSRDLRAQAEPWADAPYRDAPPSAAPMDPHGPPDVHEREGSFEVEVFDGEEDVYGGLEDGRDTFPEQGILPEDLDDAFDAEDIPGPMPPPPGAGPTFLRPPDPDFDTPPPDAAVEAPGVPGPPADRPVAVPPEGRATVPTIPTRVQPTPGRPLVADPGRLPTAGPDTSGLATFTPAADGEAELLVTLNFKDADVNQVLQLYGELRDKTIIRPPALAGTVTIRSHTKLTIDEAIQALDAVLAMNNLTVFPFGERFLKVAPLQQAKQEDIPLEIGDVGDLRSSDQLLTRIVSLRYVPAAEVLAALQPHVRGHGQIQGLERTNSVLLTETEANLERLGRIIGYLDQPSAVKVEQRIYLIEYAEATAVAGKIAELIADSQQPAQRTPAARVPTPPPPPGARVRTPTPVQQTETTVTFEQEGLTEDAVVEGRVRITADERTNQLIILNRPVNFLFFDRIIEALDRKVDPDLQIRVFQLQYAKADELGTLLGQLTGGSVGSVRRPTGRAAEAAARTGAAAAQAAAAQRIPAPPTPPAALQGVGQLEGDIRIIADDRTNFLIIMATRENLDTLEGVVQELDIEPQQVLLQAIFAEVSLDGTTEFGVEWFQRAITGYSERQIGGVDVRMPVYSFAGTVNTLPGVPADARRFSSPEASAAALGSISSGLFYFISHFDANLDIMIRALTAQSNFRIRSQPILQTSNNQPARILIGESRPVITQTQTSWEGGSLRSSYQYRDIGIELSIVPRINRRGLVVLDITNKVEDVTGFEVIDGNNVPIIATREAAAQVYMASQSTVVLGGLTATGKTLTEVGVPILRRIPLLGYLFKSQRTETRRSELIVFLTPYVLPTVAEAQAEAMRRAELLQRAEGALPWERGAVREQKRVFENPDIANGGFPATARVPLDAYGPTPTRSVAVESRERTLYDDDRPAYPQPGGPSPEELPPGAEFPPENGADPGAGFPPPDPEVPIPAVPGAVPRGEVGR